MASTTHRMPTQTQTRPTIVSENREKEIHLKHKINKRRTNVPTSEVIAFLSLFFPRRYHNDILTHLLIGERRVGLQMVQ